MAGPWRWGSVTPNDPHEAPLSAMQTPLRPPDPTSALGDPQRRVIPISASASAPPGDLLTTRQAAAALGVHERTLRRYLSSGLLEYRRLPGGHYRVPASALTDFWQANDPNLRGGYAGRRADVTQTSQASGRRRRQRPSSSKQPRLGTQATGDYDLSIGKLRALRKRLS